MGGENNYLTGAAGRPVARIAADRLIQTSRNQSHSPHAGEEPRASGATGETLAEALAQETWAALAQPPEERAQLAAVARAHAAEHHTVAALASDYAVLYERGDDDCDDIGEGDHGEGGGAGGGDDDEGSGAARGRVDGCGGPDATQRLLERDGAARLVAELSEENDRLRARLAECASASEHHRRKAMLCDVPIAALDATPP